MKLSHFTIIVIFLFIIYSCTDQSSKIKGKQVDIVKNEKEGHFNFSFGDRSVSPEYHRSYEINIELDSITVIINSYSDTLFIKKIKSPDEVFDKLSSFVDRNKIRSNEKDFNKEDNECTGSISIRISSFVNKKRINLFMTSCNSDIETNKYGDISGILNDIKREFVPAFDSWMASTMKKN